jgi:hypothetical protein
MTMGELGDAKTTLAQCETLAAHHSATRAQSPAHDEYEYCTAYVLCTQHRFTPSQLSSSSPFLPLLGSGGPGMRFRPIARCVVFCFSSSSHVPTVKYLLFVDSALGVASQHNRPLVSLSRYPGASFGAFFGACLYLTISWHVWCLF